MSGTRQLAAILFADIQSFTRLMEEDETNANLLREKMKNSVERNVEAHNGRLLKISGDGVMCTFNSAIEAVKAGIEIQKEMLQAPVVPLRIGIHEGDVIFEDGDAFGDGVNIASRIESFALAGGVFFSGKIYDDIKNQADIHTVSLGKYELKNVNPAIEIYAINSDGLIVPGKEKLLGKGQKLSRNRSWIIPTVLLISVLMALAYWKLFVPVPTIEKSIAVLPFVDMSANKDQEYFGDGLSEELLNQLSQIAELKVISRTSSFSFKGMNTDLRTIGEKLGVANILEGSVRKDKNTVRITAQLIKAADGTHLWSETYERTLDDIFKVQDEISQAVVAQLKATILEEDHAKTINKNPQAYNLMLQGKYYLTLGDDSSQLKALQFFNQAIAIEPDNAMLHALLATVHINLAGSGYLTIQECFSRARAEAEKAIALDDRLADGYTALGRIKQVYDWDWPEAEADYEKAYELDSSNADVIHRKASFARTLGKFDESIALFHKAINTDPVNVKHYLSLGIAYQNAHRFEEAKAQFRKTLELIPNYRSAHAFIGCAYIFQGKPDSGMVEIQRETHPIWKASFLPMANYALGNKEAADKLLQEFIAANQNDWAFQVAQNYAYRGDGDKTFYWLERAYDQHDGGLPELLGDPFFDKIKNDPRYLVFMKKMKLM